MPMTDTNIQCPKCGADIPLSEAVSHRLLEALPEIAPLQFLPATAES